MTINELITIAHSDAKAKGFWDGERNLAECLMLIVSECGEALEAHRKGKRADAAFLSELEWRAGTKRTPEGTFFEINDKMFINLFEERIKGSFEEELADIVIRIADHLGSLRLTDERWSLERFRNHGRAFPEMWNVGEFLFGITKDIVGLSDMVARGNDEGVKKCADRAFAGIWILAGDSDLWRHIELKLAYNRTRPYRHAKAY